MLLGEIGDCFKIAFSNPMDIHRFISGFVKKLLALVEQNYFGKLDDDRIGLFPCFNTVANTLSLPKNIHGNSISPKDIIFTTLSGAIDFNSKSLTSLFRLDNKIKLNHEIAFKNNYVCLWVFEDLLKKLNKDTDKLMEFSVGKHKTAITKERAGLFVFPGAVEKLIERPDDFIRDSELLECGT